MTEEQCLEAFFWSKSVKVQKMPILDQMGMRPAAAYLFIMVHGAPENEEDWKGQESVGPKIRKALQLNRNVKIYPTIIQNVLARLRLQGGPHRFSKFSRTSYKREDGETRFD
jgi:hypothetical protein